MLILSRKSGESITIWQSHILTVVEVLDGLVRLELLVDSRTKTTFSLSTNESKEIGPNVTLTLIETRDSKGRLGFVCPKDTPLHRKEVYDLIHPKE